MSVADIKIEAQAGETRFAYERAEVVGSAHFAESILDAEGDTGVFGVKYQVFEGTERGVALARIFGFTRAAHVQHQPRKRKVLGNIENAAKFVHGFNAARAVDFANGKRRTAFAIWAEVAIGRRVQRGES